MQLKKTVVLVSHRLANLEAFDRIYVFRDGQVAEEGSYQELAGRADSHFNFLRSKL